MRGWRIPRYPEKSCKGFMQKDYINWIRDSLKVYVSLGQIHRPTWLEKLFEALQHPHKWKDTKMSHFKSSSWVFVFQLILELSHDPELLCCSQLLSPRKLFRRRTRMPKRSITKQLVVISSRMPNFVKYRKRAVQALQRCGC